MMDTDDLALQQRTISFDAVAVIAVADVLANAVTPYAMVERTAKVDGSCVLAALP